MQVKKAHEFENILSYKVSHPFKQNTIDNQNILFGSTKNQTNIIYIMSYF